MPVVYPLAICYLLGLVAAAHWTWHPLLSVCGAAVGVAAMIAGSAKRERAFIAGLCAAGFFTACFMYHLDARMYESAPMRKHIEQRRSGRNTAAVRGVVRTAAAEQGGRVRFDLQAQSLRTGPGAWCAMPGRLRVVLPPGAATPRVGDRVELEGALTGLERLDPDMAAGLRRRHVAGFLFVHPAVPVAHRGRARVFTLFRWGEALRLRIGKVYSDHMAEPYASVMGRMVFGRAWAVPHDVYDDFRNAGVVHVLVVSGLHVSVLLGAFLWFAFVWKYNPWVSFIILAPALVLFYAMTGGGPSITRAALMGLVFLAALAAGREYHALPSLFWAGLLMMCADPHAPFQVGAQLSFLACLGIILMYPRLAPLVPGSWHAGARWPLRLVLVSLCAQAPLYPLIAYCFHKVSIVSPISNLAAVPLAMAALVAGLLCGVLGAVWSGFAAVLAPAAQALLWLLVAVVRLFAQLPFSAVVTARPTLAQALLYAAAVGGSVMAVDAWRARRGSALTRWVLCAGMAGGLLAWGFVFEFPHAEARITFIDVGQGDSALIEAPCGRGRAPVRVLVDGGGGPTSVDAAFDPGERIVGQTLFGRGITRLDAVIVTHPEEDHLNGLLWTLENAPVGRVVDLGYAPGDEGYERFRNAVRARDIPYMRGRDGLVLRAGDCLILEFLHPPAAFRGLAERNPNDVSLVFRMRFGDKAALFAGDIEGWAEDMLVSNHVSELRCDVLKTPHHGSATSSSAAFLDAAAPRLAVISAGRANVYGHPHEPVLARFKQRNIRVLRTDRHGDIDIFLPPERDLRVRTQFQDTAR
jgi:competence protein ComEC